jgi:hypothetical protein
MPKLTACKDCWWLLRRSCRPPAGLLADDESPIWYELYCRHPEAEKPPEFDPYKGCYIQVEPKNVRDVNTHGNCPNFRPLTDDGGGPA